MSFGYIYQDIVFNTNLMKIFSFLLLLFIFIAVPTIEVNGQSKFNDRSRKLNKFKYRTHIGKPSKKCTALKRKKKNGPDVAKKYKLGKKPKVKKMAESDLSFNFKDSDNTWISTINDNYSNIIVFAANNLIIKDLSLAYCDKSLINKTPILLFPS